MELLSRRPGTPNVHWLGHSFGALITLDLLKKKRLEFVKSCVLSAPFLGLTHPAPPVKKFFGELLEPVLGHLSLTNEIDPKVLSHDPSVAPAYVADPLNHDRITPRTFVEMMKKIEEIKAWHGPVELPLLTMIPLDDPLCDPRMSWNFFQQLQNPRKKLQTFPGMFHEIFNEAQKDLGFNCLANWLEEL
jgi:alpha-beta hydrolase superfamily lysophospholipase